jgi:hypothetical protein
MSMRWAASSVGVTPLLDSRPTGSALPGTGTLSRESQPRSMSSWTGCCGVIQTASESRVRARATETDCVSVRPGGSAMPWAAKNPSTSWRGAVPTLGMTSG